MTEHSTSIGGRITIKTALQNSTSIGGTITIKTVLIWIFRMTSQYLNFFHF